MISAVIQSTSVRSAFLSLVLILGLLISLSSCLDHRLGGPQSPVRLRLKTVQGGAINTSYIYNAQNRLVTILPADGSQTVLTYDSQNRLADLKQYPNPADIAFGTATLLSYGADGVSFQAKTHYILRSVVETDVVRNTAFYSFDANKHIADVTNQTQEGRYSGQFYTYTGENITSSAFLASRNTTHYVYEYDDKINPFFGSTDPLILNDYYMTGPQRFSRNNVTKIYYIDSDGHMIPTGTFQYEYNAQGLPTKRTTVGSNDVTTYTYESY